MHSSSQHVNGEEYNQEWTRERGKYKKLFIVKCGIGILLLVLGILADRNTSGQTDTFGPPYFFGAFIVGISMILAGLVNISIYKNSARAQKLSQYVVIEGLFTVIAVIGGVFGIVFVSIFGIPKCEPVELYYTCNYTKNISTNRKLAVAILIFLLVSEIIAIVSILIHCHVASQQRFNARRNVHFAGSAGSVVMATTPEPSPVSRHQSRDCDSGDTYVLIDGNVVKKKRGGLSGGVKHPPQGTVVHEPVGYPRYSGATNQNTQYFAGSTGSIVMATVPEPSPVIHHQSRDCDSNSGDTYVLIDGNVIKKKRGGVIHPPQGTVIREPVGYPRYSGATNQNTQYRPEGQGFPSDGSINRLQEQNRLLREQIALQQQLQLMQQHQQQQLQQQQQQQLQQQQIASSSALPPPPPSYESCMQDPAEFKFLQEQNEELQERCLSQQEQMTERIPLTGYRGNRPSASPL